MSCNWFSIAFLSVSLVLWAWKDSTNRRKMQVQFRGPWFVERTFQVWQCFLRKLLRTLITVLESMAILHCGPRNYKLFYKHIKDIEIYLAVVASYSMLVT